ncbi:hypothetical protein G4G28_22260 [Massilia sp. Dwa41.01b]|uniref:hypothetical protein n=1 Tax=Massilia sp. Dwa41.01b TaxID=2709302 RepID=UPI001601086C|nr:hypothetical protein G4G28_22260 [Massilia sp. Dwa41.01b]
MPKMREAWALLHAAGAELVLSGHDHDYERFAPQDADGRRDPGGIRQFVVGTGGGLSDALPAPGRAQRNARRQPQRRPAPAPLPGRLRLGVPEATAPQLPNPSPPDHGSGRCH